MTYKTNVKKVTHLTHLAHIQVTQSFNTVR